MDNSQTILTDAIKRAGANLDAKYNAASADAQKDTNPVTWAMDAVNSAGLGIAKAGIETKEFFTGQPKYEDRWPIQRAIEADAAELDRRSGINAFVGDTSQFITGMVGLGKLTGGIKAVQALGAAGKFGRLGLEVAKGAAVGSVAFDPQEERLSNLLESYPQLSNPVSQFLAAKPTDSDAEGRIKSAFESIGMDLAITGGLVASLKFLRAFRGGDEAAIAAANAELQATQGGHMGDDQVSPLRARPRRRGSFLPKPTPPPIRGALRRRTGPSPSRLQSRARCSPARPRPRCLPHPWTLQGCLNLAP